MAKHSEKTLARIYGKSREAIAGCGVWREQRKQIIGEQSRLLREPEPWREVRLYRVQGENELFLK